MLFLRSSASCLTWKGGRRSSTHKLQEGLELEVSHQAAVLYHRPPRDVQVVFLGPEAEGSLDPEQMRDSQSGPIVAISRLSPTLRQRGRPGSLHSHRDREAHSLLHPCTAWVISTLFLRLNQYLSLFQRCPNFVCLHSPLVILLPCLYSTYSINT